MRISLIVSTYNWAAALRLSLQSALDQTFPPQEIVVADDGSGAETAALVKDFATKSTVPIIHSWQEDKGFRAAKSRNRALARATGDYILFIDGDIVIDRHFVQDHQANAQRGCCVQGPRALLGSHLTEETLATGQLKIPRFARGLGNKKNCIRSRGLARLFSHTSTRLQGVRLCNFAVWKKDAIAVNGFNEQFSGWGREDSEFVARLLHSGITRKNLKFLALGYHLHHPLNTRERLMINDAILQKTIENRSIWCAEGVDQYME